MENKFKCDCDCLHENEVKLAKSVIKKTKEINILCNFFKAFADNTRLKIMCVLDNVKQMCVCDIAVSLNMTKSAISHQLRYLKEAMLIKSNKLGKEVFYSLADDHVKTIFEMGIEHIKEMN